MLTCATVRSLCLHILWECESSVTLCHQAWRAGQLQMSEGERAHKRERKHKRASARWVPLQLEHAQCGVTHLFHFISFCFAHFKNEIQFQFFVFFFQFSCDSSALACRRRTVTAAGTARYCSGYIAGCALINHSIKHTHTHTKSFIKWSELKFVRRIVALSFEQTHNCPQSEWKQLVAAPQKNYKYEYE